MSLGGGVHGRRGLEVGPPAGGVLLGEGSSAGLLGLAGLAGVLGCRWEEWQQQQRSVVPARSRTRGVGLVEQDSWSRTCEARHVEQD